MGFLNKLQSSTCSVMQLYLHCANRETELELYRLEQKYAKRKNRQTFTTGATYIDGEYRYDDALSAPISASSTGSSNSRTKRASMFLGAKR